MLGQGKKSKAASTRVDTIIGQQTRIEGDVHFTGGLHLAFGQGRHDLSHLAAEHGAGNAVEGAGLGLAGG